MTWFRVRNKSKLPIHVAISWGGIIQHHKNDIQPGGYCEWDVPGLGWHDMTGVVSNGSNQFDPSKDNLSAIGKWIIGGAGVLLAAGGIALLPFTGGSSTAMVVTGISVAVSGAIVTTADIVVAGIHAALHPVSVSNLYGPDGYNVDFTGAEVIGTYDKDTKTFTVTDVTPLKLNWKNNNTGNSGTETAAR